MADWPSVRAAGSEIIINSGSSEVSGGIAFVVISSYLAQNSRSGRWK